MIIWSGYLIDDKPSVVTKPKQLSQSQQKVIMKAIHNGSKNKGNKVVQIDDYIVAFSSFLFKSQNFSSFIVGKDLTPSRMMNSTGNLSEKFIKEINIDYNNPLGQDSMMTLLTKENNSLLRNENKEKSGMQKIENNLEESVKISQQNFEMLMERENSLNDLESHSNILSNSALNFEQTGRALKQKIMMEKIKAMCAIGILIVGSGLIIYYIIQIISNFTKIKKNEKLFLKFIRIFQQENF